MKKKEGKVINAFKWDLFGTLFKHLFVLTVSVTLARILAPEEFGIIGIALVFINLSQVLIDIGFTQGLIQNQNNSQIIYSSIFFINLILGLIVSGLIFISAPFIGSFYDDKQVTEVVRLLFLIPILSSLSSVHLAILTKKLNFKAIASRKIISSLIAGVIAIWMALNDFGVYALVAQQLTLSFLFCIIIWWQSNWRPTLEFSISETKKLMSFSGFVFLDNVLRRLFLQVDTLFIGKYFSPATLGFYSRAASLNTQVLDYTTGSLRKVMFPAISRIQKDERLFESTYFEVYNLSAFIGSLACGCLYLLSEDIILLLLGEKWRPSILIFQILVFRILLGPFGALIGKSLLAKGFSKEKFKLGLLRRIILLGPLFWAYLFGGINAFASALVIANFIGFILSLVWSHRLLHFSFFLQLKLFFQPIFPVLLMIALDLFFDESNSILLVLFFTVMYFAYSIITKAPGFNFLLSRLKRS